MNTSIRLFYSLKYTTNVLTLYIFRIAAATRKSKIIDHSYGEYRMMQKLILMSMQN